MRQTESNSREDKIAKLVGKTFFYFVSEAIKGENNTFNTKEFLQIDKKVQCDYNSCYEKTIENMRNNEIVMQGINFPLVGQNYKSLTASLTRLQIKIPIPEDLKDLEITQIQTKQGFHLGFRYNYINYSNSILKKYKNMCSFRFTRNFIRRGDSRKKSAPKFAIETQY